MNKMKYNAMVIKLLATIKSNKLNKKSLHDIRNVMSHTFNTYIKNIMNDNVNCRSRLIICKIHWVHKFHNSMLKSIMLMKEM